MKLKSISSLLIILFALTVKAQDTLKVNIQQADSLFLKKNFMLLASSMNVEAQRAQIIQARVYPNPIFTADFNAYDPVNDKAFHVGPTGEKAFQFEQLILIGGKRKAEIDMAKTNASIAELEFQQLLRQLKFQLHSDLFSIGQLNALLIRYNQQMDLLETLLTSYETQAAKGNIALKEVVRLKGAYLKLNNERAALLKEYYETQSSLQTILQTTSVVMFEFSENDISKYIQQKTLDDLKSEALKNRPDLQIVQNNKILAEQNLKYQRRLAVPDLNFITSYDQHGGVFNNQVNVGFAIPLPFWDRNRGNIKTSKFRIQEAEYNLQSEESKMYSELQNAYSVYTQTVSEYGKATTIYNSDFELTVNGMTENFKKRNINIVEFIDFFEAYNDALNELTRIKTQLVISAEQINLLTGKDIY
ncbi:MAG: TolC family protein [Bacteroidetes bacterium]|jgi:cobalt-zinc-cadmium efflux system outer membrane protein|nr:TolC family protein [Bacteroidota bacterium]